LEGRTGEKLGSHDDLIEGGESTIFSSTTDIPALIDVVEATDT
jgi:hypothetical protein